MRRFRRYFALLFILSLFVGVAHEMSHAHHQGDVCEVCVLAHSPALLGDASPLALVVQTYEPFAAPAASQPFKLSIPGRSRSPPLT